MSVSLKDAPDPHDVTDFRFQGLRKVRLSGSVSLNSSRLSLVTTVPKAGLVVVAGDKCIHMLNTADIEKQDQCSKAERAVENSKLNKVTMNLPGEVLSVGVSCDGLTTSVVVKVGQFPTCLLFDTRGLISSPPDLPLSSTSLNTTSSSVMMTGLHWNPALSDMFCVTWSDGSLALYTVKPDGSTDCLTLPPAAGVVDMAWSPKGKQLVVVKNNKDLMQYKPDLSVAKYPTLKEMKTIPGPVQPGLVPVSIAWLSTYEFLVGLRDSTDSEARPGLWLVKGSKVGDVEYTNYDDICYSTGEGEEMMFTSVSLQEWGVVVVCSSGSIELGVLGTDSTAGYTQWILEDNARAEIPLDSGKEECYPAGLAVDYTCMVGTPVGETTGPPSPLLYLLSTDGLLCPFYCVNTKQGVSPLCSPPVPLPAASKRAGTVPLPLPAIQPKPSVGISLQQPSVISSIPSKPAANLSNLFNMSSNSSFAQSTPVKPLPSSTSLFKPPITTKEITPPLPALTKIDKKPPPPVSVFSKDPTPPFGNIALQSSPFGNQAKDLMPQFGKQDKDPTPPFGKAIKDPTPPFSKDQTPPMYKTLKDTLNNDFKVNTSKETTPVSDSTTAKISAAIDEEYEAFEDELKELRVSLGNMKTFIGTQQDKIDLCTRTEACSKFCRDVIDTTQCQNTEIFSLRSSTLETFSWLEEARARDSSTGDTRYLQLLRARPLDPRSIRRMEDLRTQFFYCEQQVEEVGNALDSQWEEHVGKLKRTVRGDQPNVREELSQAVMTNHKILERQSEVVGEITDKVKKLQASYPITMGRHGSSPDKSRAESELDKLADSLRDKSKLSPKKPTGNISTPSPVKATPSNIVSPVKALTPTIDKTLRSLLDNRPLSITKAVRRNTQDRPSCSKLLEKLKVSTPVTLPKIVASGSLAFTGLSSDKSAFQAVTPTSKTKQAVFQPASLPKKSPVFTSGSISVEVSASPLVTKTIRAPVYEPISPASNSPEKTEVVLEPKVGGLVGKPAFGNIQAAAVAVDKTKVIQATSKSLFGQPSSTSASSIGDTAKSALSSAFSFGSSSTVSSLLLTSTSTSSTSSSISSSFGGSSVFSGSSSSASSAPSSNNSITSSIVSSGVSAESSVFNTKQVPAFDVSDRPSTGGSLFSAVTTSSSSVSVGVAIPLLVAASTASSMSKSKSPSSALASTLSSVGAKSANSSSPSVFGGASDKISVSAGLTSSGTVFGGEQPVSVSSGTSKQTLSVFEGISKPASTGSVFGGTTKTISSGSVFGGISQPASSGSAFGTSDQPASSISVFGGTAPSGSVFGGAAQTTSSGSVFGGTAQPTSSGSVFGGTAQTTSSGSAFSEVSKPASAASVLGGSTQPISLSSVFVETTKPVTSASVFGGTSQPSSSVFGGTAPPASSASVFGGTTQPTSSASVFETVQTASGSVFGGPSQPASAGAVFGATTLTVSSDSAFGGAKPSSSGSIFGGTSQTATTSSVFGGTSQPVASGSLAFGASSGSVFGGSSQPVSSGSIFGGTSSSGSVFGSSKPVGSGAIFGGTTPSVSASQPSVSAFGGSAPVASGSIFGGTSKTASTSGAIFGGTTPSVSASQSSVSAFGGSAPVASGSVFGGTSQPGSTSGSVFGGVSQPVSSSGSVFGGGSAGGGFLGGLGGTASTENSGKNPFGGASASSSFGESSAGGLFGSSGTTSVFGGTSQASTFGSSSAFSAGANIASQGFGVQQNTPVNPASGFGGAAAFGSPPALGSPQAFGSTAGFGASAAFGGGATFGAAAASAPTFGAAGATAPTFGGAAAAAPAFGAASNASSFGAMAGSASPAFGSMGGSTPAFGSGGSGFGAAAPSSPPPAGRQFNSWR